VTGAEILSTFDCPERKNEVLGKCTQIEEIMIGEDKVIKFSGCAKGRVERRGNNSAKERPAR